MTRLRHQRGMGQDRRRAFRIDDRRTRREPGTCLPDLTYYWNRIQAHAGHEDVPSMT